MATRDSTRTRLLDAADQLLFSEGLLATPVDAILARAGVSPATLYRAYDSKEDLVAAALTRRHAAWLEVWDAAIDDAGDDRGRLLAVLDALSTFRRRPDGARWCAFLGAAAEYADPPPALAEAVALDGRVMRERLLLLASPLTAGGGEELADAMMLVVSGRLAMDLRRRGDDAVARQVAEAVVDRLCASPASTA